MARRRESEPPPADSNAEWLRLAARYVVRLHGPVVSGAEVMAMTDAELRELAEQMECGTALRYLDDAAKSDRERKPWPRPTIDHQTKRSCCQ